MKVLHITNNYPTNKYPIFGIFVKEQINSLSEIGINSDLLFINARENGKCEYISSIFSLKKILKNNSYDIIHCHHTFSAFILFLSTLFKKKKNRYVVSFQCDPSKEFFGILYFLIRTKFDAFIYKNKFNFIDSKSYYLPNGVNEKFFKNFSKKDARDFLSLDHNKKYILFVSSNFIRKQKRYDVFKNTIKYLQSNYPQYNFEPLLMINIERSKVPYYFNAADLHLLTSDYEGSPNSVKESIFCNTPVVSTNVGNVEDIFNSLPGCFISKSNSPSELSKLVIKAINFTKFEGRKILIKKAYSIKNVAIKLKNIYNEL